jgi:hypothetical protein
MIDGIRVFLTQVSEGVSGTAELTMKDILR